MLTAQQFYNEWIGKSANPDRDPYGAQCVELANELCKELGIEEFGGNAADFVYDPHPDCDWIPYQFGRMPKPLDIVVWGAWPGNRYGHVDVAIDNITIYGYDGLDQNWINSNITKGSPAARVHHSYTSPLVAGWYHPRILDARPPEEEEMFEARTVRPGTTWFLPGPTQNTYWNAVSEYGAKITVEVLDPSTGKVLGGWVEVVLQPNQPNRVGPIQGNGQAKDQGATGPCTLGFTNLGPGDVEFVAHGL